MLKETLNIEMNLRIVQAAQVYEDAAAGNYDLLITSITSTLMDPSDFFGAWYGKDGPLNFSQWTNPAFHELARQIEREVDQGKRKTMVRQAEAILESDPPTLPLCYEKIYDAWYDRVRGQNPSTYFGIYDVDRWDTVWLAS
jgi:ABC-type oligopeptide transport system substrate-binding subunit